MHLLQVTPSYKPAYGYGGTITSIGLLCETLTAEGCAVTVITTTANGESELPLHADKPNLVEGVPVFYFPRWTKDHSHFSPALLRWLWSNVKSFDAVHIHSWWNLVALFSVGVCILRGVKPVVSPRGMLSSFTIKGRIRPLFHRTMGKWLLKNTFLHATSRQESEEGLALITKWQHAILPNLCQIPVFNYPPQETTSPKQIEDNSKPNTFNLLFFSRLHPKKGLEGLFDALKHTPFNWTLTIAGDGDADYIQQLKTRAKNLHIDSKINWLGWVEPTNRFAIFQAADLFVLPSHNENFANVVIESLAVGTPVLISEHVGLADYVQRKNLGWICHTTVRSIQEKLAEAYYQKVKRAQIRQNSNAQIRQDFAPSVLAQEYCTMYERVKYKHEMG
jgi:glycosyltransferase involved in cell wall biosynthesis